MTTEKVSVEQAVQRLSDASINQQTRMLDLEQKINAICNDTTKQNQSSTDPLSTELTTLETNMVQRIENMQIQTQNWQTDTITKLEEGQQQWSYLTAAVRDMKKEIEKITATVTGNMSTNNTNQAAGEYASLPYAYRNTSTPNGAADSSIPVAPNISDEHHHSQHTSSTISNGPVIHTVVVPPTSAIPIFHGKISENPRQFLIRIKEYTHTVNQWNENGLLNGISQFLRDTALEWYCQLRMTHRRPQSWTEFVALFLAQFNSSIRRARQEQEWRECKQQGNETINEFVVRLRSLWSEQKPNETEADLVRHLMCKMRNDLLTMIGVSRCESLDEIIMEAQKLEEILYQRSKYQRPSNNVKQESSRADTYATAVYQDDEQFELQAMSAHQSYPRSNTYEKTRRRTQNDANPIRSPRYTNYSSNSTTNRRQAQSINEIKCYSCGMTGHLASNCPGQYHTDQQQQSGYYPKNDHGAHGRRDYGAPQYSIPSSNPPSSY